MIVSISTSGLKQSKWYEYLIRFALGGLVTAGAGAIAKKFGAELAGLFLAFPAILVASTSLVEKHEQERKQKKGLNGFYRGRQAAGADAAGAAMGSLGLMAFAALAWKFLPGYRPLLVIPGAGLLWALVAATVWWLWKRNFPRRLRAAVSGPFMRRR
ncbi:MAG: DUF3147 family protein [Acidobacteria bacterium]|nr:DUF3147 family protein [Acidobacteriota bacterium]